MVSVCTPHIDFNIAEIFIKILLLMLTASKFLSFANDQNAAEKLGLTKGDRVEIVSLIG